MSGRVLIVEDAEAFRAAATSALRRQGFAVSSCGTRTDLVRALDQVAPQVVILDPPGPAHDLLRLVRRHSRASVLLVARRGMSPSQVRGADECLRRPFTMVELIARVRTLSRRGAKPAGVLVVGGLHISENANCVQHREHEIALTRTERKLLAYLAAHHGRVVAKKDLLAGIWGLDNGDANVVEVNVSTLRRKLEQHVPRIVHTVRGQGYRLGECRVETG